MGRKRKVFKRSPSMHLQILPILILYLILAMLYLSSLFSPTKKNMAVVLKIVIIIMTLVVIVITNWFWKKKKTLILYGPYWFAWWWMEHGVNTVYMLPIYLTDCIPLEGQGAFPMTIMKVRVKILLLQLYLSLPASTKYREISMRI